MKALKILEKIVGYGLAIFILHQIIGMWLAIVLIGIAIGLMSLLPTALYRWLTTKQK